MEGRFSLGGSFRLKSKVPRSRNSRPLSCDLSDFSSCFYDQGQEDTNSESPPPYEEAILDKDWEQSIGERVCISGVKHGILRYYGRTKFAEGLWCGVELDEPVGKNNGTVNGVQYFIAKPNHGIFAPVGKVSKVESSWAAELESFRSLYNSDRNLMVKVPQSTLPDQMLLKQSSSDPSFVGQQASTEFSAGLGTFLGDKRSLTEQRELSRLAKKVKSNTVFYTFSENSGKYKALPPRPANCEQTSSDSSSDDAVYSRTQGSTTHNTFNSTISSSLNNGVPSQPTRKASYDTALQAGPKTTGIKQSLSFPRSVNFPSIDLDTEALSHFGDHKIPAANDPPTALNKQHSTDYHNEIFPLNFFLAAEHRDDNDDDDQMSLDVDESLGILTPNQMKDFTISADPLNSCTELKTFTFPSSESFDDINDIPEDEEVCDITVEYVGSSNNAPDHKKPCDATSDVLEQTVNEKQLSSTDNFLYSYSTKVSNQENEADPLNKIRGFNKTFPNLEKKEGDAFDIGVSKAKCVMETVESIGNYEVPTVSKLDIKKEPPKLSYDSREITFLCEQNNSVYTSFETDANKTKFEKSSPSLRHLDDVNVRKYYDTDSSRDSLLQGDHDHVIPKEKQLTVSWEDCIERDTDEMFTRVERPESVYTVGSNDTGYQEDGEFDAEIGMTTSTESNETGKRFSTISRDSCLASEDLDKVTESTSTSGYSTGLSDSYCNDRADDDMPKQAAGDSFPGTEIRRSADDDLFHCPQRISHTIHVEANANHSVSEKEFAENETTGYSETTSISHDFTNDDIVSCLENTVNAWPETSNEDTTIAEQVNGDLEESVCAEKTMVNDSDDHSFAKTGDVAETENQKEPIKVSVEADDTCILISEKPKSKTVQLSVQEGRTSEKSAEIHSTKFKREDERRKQITKSPRKNVMSKIKAMIEATSCKTIGRSKTETSEHAEKKAATVHKKSRWEAVTSKIAASLAEEKSKSKSKREIKSKVNTNLSLVRQQRNCKSPRLDSARVSDAEAGSVSSVSSKGVRETKCSSAVVQKHEQQQPVEKSRGRSPRHITRLLSLVAGCAPVCRMMYVIHTPTGSGGKPCMSSRSTSPVAASESSTTVSLTSHNSKARIAVWKGSTSTIASSIPPPQVKKPSHPAPSKASINRNTAKTTPKRGTDLNNLTQNYGDLE